MLSLLFGSLASTSLTAMDSAALCMPGVKIKGRLYDTKLNILKITEEDLKILTVCKHKLLCGSLHFPPHFLLCWICLKYIATLAALIECSIARFTDITYSRSYTVSDNEMCEKFSKLLNIQLFCRSCAQLLYDEIIIIHLAMGQMNLILLLREEKIKGFSLISKNSLVFENGQMPTIKKIFVRKKHWFQLYCIHACITVCINC